MWRPDRKVGRLQDEKGCPLVWDTGDKWQLEKQCPANRVQSQKAADKIGAIKGHFAKTTQRSRFKVEEEIQ